MTRNMWQIEDCDQETRRKVKAFAALHGLTMAQALKRIVELAGI